MWTKKKCAKVFVLESEGVEVLLVDLMTYPLHRGLCMIGSEGKSEYIIHYDVFLVNIFNFCYWSSSFSISSLCTLASVEPL